jgi:hypothetical protein
MRHANGRKLYVVNPTASGLIGEPRNSKLRVVHAGLEVLKCNRNRKGVSQPWQVQVCILHFILLRSIVFSFLCNLRHTQGACLYRLSQEGIYALAPHMPRQVTLAFLCYVYIELSPPAFPPFLQNEYGPELVITCPNLIQVVAASKEDFLVILREIIASTAAAELATANSATTTNSGWDTAKTANATITATNTSTTTTTSASTNSTTTDTTTDTVALIVGTTTNDIAPDSNTGKAKSSAEAMETAADKPDVELGTDTTLTLKLWKY